MRCVLHGPAPVAEEEGEHILPSLCRPGSEFLQLGLRLVGLTETPCRLQLLRQALPTRLAQSPTQSSDCSFALIHRDDELAARLLEVLLRRVRYLRVSVRFECLFQYPKRLVRAPRRVSIRAYQLRLLQLNAASSRSCTRWFLTAIISLNASVSCVWMFPAPTSALPACSSADSAVSPRVLLAFQLLLGPSSTPVSCCWGTSAHLCPTEDRLHTCRLPFWFVGPGLSGSDCPLRLYVGS